MTTIRLLMVLSLGFADVAAQDLFLERLLEQEDERISESIVLELLDNPLDLRTVARDDLLQLPFLGLSQINSFIRTRNRRDWHDKADALSALGVGGDTLVFCNRIFYLSSPRISTWQSDARVRVARPPNAERAWQGPPLRSYARLKTGLGNVAFGALAERDPGEPRFDDLRLFSAGMSLHTGVAEVDFQAGHYFIEWGQGLALWGPYGHGIGSPVNAAVRKRARGIRPYLLSDESAAFYGAAMTWRLAKLDILAFISRRRVDAIRRDPTTAVLVDTGGLHRTINEQSKQDQVMERARGAGLRASGGHWRAGALWLQQDFDHRIVPTGHPADFFDFQGRQNHHVSCFGELSLSRTRLAGEWVRGASGAIAQQINFETEARPVLLAGAWWNYARDFHSPRGRAFGAFQSPPQNEQGQYLGLRLQVRRGVHFESYSQRRRRPWRTREMPLFGASRDDGLQLECKIPRGTLRVRWREHQSEDLMQESQSGRAMVGIRRTRQLSLEILHRWSRAVQLVSRLEIRRPDPVPPVAARHPVAVSQRVAWKPHARVEVCMSLAVFDIPAGQAIYVYERDLPGLLTNSALREPGERGYIYCTVQTLARLRVSAKLAKTWTMEGEGSVSWALQVDWQSPKPDRRHRP